MKAMILAAGFGTRLFPLTIDRTKPAIPFLGKPLVGYVAEYVANYGFKDVIVNLHHQPESVKNALGKGENFGVKIEYTLESPEILGTAGALWNAKDLLKDETFLVVNGKVITNIDLQAALETHKKTRAVATMILIENTKLEKFSIIETENGLIKGFGGFPQATNDENQKPKTENRKPYLFTGIQILEPKVFDYIPANRESDIISTFYRPAIANGEIIAAHVAENCYWYELSTIPRYLDISNAVLNGENNGLSRGDNCQIAENADVTNSILWNDVIIESDATVKNAILGDGVKINSGEIVENKCVVRARLMRGAEIPEKALTGYFDGDNYVVPLV
ncbi:MAG: NDP-sugar synthase [Pyrinomonadaceae bacterium]|nr:NDP-sugar synthase [Pyrinomonadaceae bacterium]